jgi:hypothetical protein
MDRVFDQCTRGRVNILRLPEVGPLELDGGAAAPESWTDGTVYLLPPDTFTPTYDAEWISPTPVRPRARLAVTRADFPFAGQVFRHRSGESDASFIARLARAGLVGS